MKLSDLKDRCNQLGIKPVPTRHRKNPDRFEVCADDCIKAIQQYNISSLKIWMHLDEANNAEILTQMKSPMLAKLIKHQNDDIKKEIWDDDNSTWRFERKYDGIRCLLLYNGDTRKFYVYGRELDDVTLLPKNYSSKFAFTNNIIPLVATTSTMTDSFIIDCELIIDGFRHDVIQDILNDPYKDMEQFDYKFMIFDLLNISDFIQSKLISKSRIIFNNVQLYTRLQRLYNLHAMLSMYYLPLYLVDSKPSDMSKEDYYNSIINTGGEGVIAKKMNSSYDIDGSRNGNWTKIKRLKYEGLGSLDTDTYDLFVSDYIINDNMVSGLELSSYLVDKNNNYVYDRFNNQIPVTLGILYDLLPDTKKILTLYNSEGKPYINPRFLDMVVEVKSSGFDDSTNQLQNLQFVCWRLDKNSRDCKYNKDKI